MIVITICILYFIQIRYTHYFPSTGTRLVSVMIDVVIAAMPQRNIAYNPGRQNAY